MVRTGSQTALRHTRYRPVLVAPAPRSSCANLLIQLELTRNWVRSFISRLRRQTGAATTSPLLDWMAVPGLPLGRSHSEQSATDSEILPITCPRNPHSA